MNLIFKTPAWSAFLLLVSFFVTAYAEVSVQRVFRPNETLSLGIVVYPGFEPLDVFGPLELFYSMSAGHNITLSIIAKKAGLVSAAVPPLRPLGEGPIQEIKQGVKPSILATHSLATAPALNVLLIPGGYGLVAMDQVNDTAIPDFIASRFPQVDYLLSVCIGSVFLANAGVLSGRRATSNKGIFSWVTTHGTNVTWVPTARWVQDGRIWTSSGVAAGIDMTYAFLAHVYGVDDEALVSTMNGIEYAPHVNSSWDPFSIVHKVPGADLNGNLTDCVKPVGY